MTLFWLTWTLSLMAAAPSPEGPNRQAIAALAQRALDGDTTAISALRALGQPGLDVLITVRTELSSVPPSPSFDPRAANWDALIDKVARQQYATQSGLYWYTDLTSASAVARKQGKPILSLRLLGDLDETLSCANSRFFRTILYPDPAVRKALHDRFVLHWESVRKAPQITIDFGDGRTVKRTVTGNSLHYMLDATGRVIDALPGLHSASAFTAWLDDAGALATQLASASDEAFKTARDAAHRAWKLSRLTRWQKALAAVGLVVPLDQSALGVATTDKVLDDLARMRPEAMRIDPEVASFLGRAFPTAEVAAPIAVTKAVIERPMLPWLRNLRGSIAKDEVMNDFVTHTAVHDLFIDRPATDPAPFTRAIYAAVFLTPLDDPFMGLASPDVFTGIPDHVEVTGRELGLMLVRP